MASRPAAAAGLWAPQEDTLPMTNFDDRKKTAENKFALDEELRFKAQARRNRLLGQWAAALLGKSGDDAQAYVRAVVAADLEEAGDEDVFRKVRKDFDAAGVTESDDTIRHQMVMLLSQAVTEVKEGR
jgi:hypothetical protein